MPPIGNKFLELRLIGYNLVERQGVLDSRHVAHVAELHIGVKQKRLIPESLGEKRREHGDRASTCASARAHYGKRTCGFFGRPLSRRSTKLAARHACRIGDRRLNGRPRPLIQTRGNGGRASPSRCDRRQIAKGFGRLACRERRSAVGRLKAIVVSVIRIGALSSSVLRGEIGLGQCRIDAGRACPAFKRASPIERQEANALFAGILFDSGRKIYGLHIVT